MDSMGFSWYFALLNLKKVPNFQVACFAKEYPEKIWRNLTRDVTQHWTLEDIKCSFKHFTTVTAGPCVKEYTPMFISQMVHVNTVTGTKRREIRPTKEKNIAKRRKR